MKLIASVILSLTLLDVFHCAPCLLRINDGKYTETHKSSSWGFGGGITAGVGLEGGVAGGNTHFGIKPEVGIKLTGHKDSDQVQINRAIPAWPAPNYFAPGYGYPYGIPNNPANGIQYALPYIPQYAPQAAPPNAPVYAPQAAPPNAPVYAPPAAPPNVPVYTPQAAPPNTPVYAPQPALPNTPVYAPQATLPNAPQANPQITPLYTTQAAPPYVPQNIDDISQVN